MTAREDSADKTRYIRGTVSAVELPRVAVYGLSTWS